jgi:hypothetical protein
MTDSRDEHEPYGFTESPVIARLQAELARLTAERDEARRMYCYAIPENCDEHEARKIAWERGWDCWKEDGK